MKIDDDNIDSLRQFKREEFETSLKDSIKQTANKYKEQLDKEELIAAYVQLVSPTAAIGMPELANSFIDKHMNNEESSKLNRTRACYLFALKDMNNKLETTALFLMEMVAREFIFPVDTP